MKFRNEVLSKPKNLEIKQASVALRHTVAIAEAGDVGRPWT